MGHTERQPRSRGRDASRTGRESSVSSPSFDAGQARGSGPDFSRGLEALAGLIGFLAVEGGGRGPGVLSPDKPPAVQANMAVPDARKRRRAELLKRRGRRSTILSGGSGVIGEAPLSQPQALGG